MKKNKYSIIGSIICIVAMIIVIIIHILLANNYQTPGEKTAFFYGAKEQYMCFGICVFCGFISLLFCLYGLLKHEAWKYIIINSILTISLIPFALLPFWEWMV